MVDSERLKQELNILYGKLYTINDKLLQKSEDYSAEKYKFKDIFDFYITSHALCYIKNCYLGDFKSSGFFLNARCFIEGIALKRMFESGDITDLNEKLIQKQLFLIEYKEYKRFPDIADVILLPEKLYEDYQKACDFFREQLKGTLFEGNAEKIINSRIPFLCDPSINYKKVVEKYLSKEIAIVYGIYSSILHPSNNKHYLFEENELWAKLVIALICEEYGSFSLYTTTLEEDVMKTTSEYSLAFVKNNTQEAELLMNVANVFEQFFGNNYTSNTFRCIEFSINDLGIEKSMGLCEHIKCKWKPLLELFATFYYVYFTYFGEELRYKLLDLHTQMQGERNKQIEFNTENAYYVYRQIYPDGCSKEIFDKNFVSIVGYTIDEKGKIMSLTQIVKNFLDKFALNCEGELTLGKAMFLDYVESQMLSHANGYMWFANSGAWGDVNNIFIGIDASLTLIFELLYNVFSTHKASENSNYYKPIINVLRNSLKKIKEISKNKKVIMELPMMKKWHENQE